mmetsp:Transcript_45772/g.139060  ORF Transcript_45772/g.139060 Transcript_45772/m.139060 type:complete len:147 (-) Transcript_45772:325-765(-)
MLELRLRGPDEIRTIIGKGAGPCDKHRLSIVENVCLDGMGKNMFNIFDSAGNGIYCKYGRGFYRLVTNGERDLFCTSIGKFGVSEKVDIPEDGSSPCPPIEVLFQLELLTDDYAAESSWTLEELNSEDGNKNAHLIASQDAGYNKK